MSTPESTFQPEDALIVDMVGSRLSTATVLYHTAVADRLGVSATDMKCYTILRETGPITAGELARRARLTTGGVTGVVDRLEQAGLVRRVADPHDRRRVVLERADDPARAQAIDALYQPLGMAVGALLRSYSAEQRALIADFLGKVTAILTAETDALRSGSASDGGTQR